jgi:hypothetical protein
MYTWCGVGCIRPHYALWMRWHWREQRGVFLWNVVYMCMCALARSDSDSHPLPPTPVDVCHTQSLAPCHYWHANTAMGNVPLWSAVCRLVHQWSCTEIHLHPYITTHHTNSSDVHQRAIRRRVTCRNDSLTMICIQAGYQTYWQTCVASSLVICWLVPGVGNAYRRIRHTQLNCT